MRKVFWAAALGAALFVTGITSTVRDYATIGLRNVVSLGKKSIPISVEIDRLELSLQQLDGYTIRGVDQVRPAAAFRHHAAPDRPS